MQAVRADFDVSFLHPIAGLDFVAVGQGRALVENYAGWFASYFGQIIGRTDRIDIQDRRLAWDQNEVRRFACDQRRAICIRSTVENQNIEATGLRLRLDALQLFRTRAHSFGGRLTALRPFPRRRLRIKVYDGRLISGLMGSKREVQGEGGFACTTFLRNQG